MADKRFVDFRLDSTPGSGSYLVGHDSAGTEFRIPVSSLLGSIVVPEAQSIYVQYSANGSSWVTVWTSGCKFMRIKIGAGAWSNAMAIADVVNVATMVKVGNTLVGSGSDYVELEAGTNVTLTPDAANNKVTISATGGGGGGGSAVQSDWEQDDDTANDYIKNKPTIPSKTSDLTNDSGFLTQHQDISGKVDKVSGKGLSTNDYTTTEKNKLAGIAAGAEVNVQSDWSQSDSSADDYIKNKPAIPSKTSELTNDSGFLTQHQDISGKVDKVSGKGLSTNDYTTTEKNKLAGIAAGAEVNVQSDWNQSNSSADDYIKNKPAIPTVNNPLITLTQGGVTKGAFNLNQSSAQTINLDAGGGGGLQVVSVDMIAYDVNNNKYYSGISLYNGLTAFNISDALIYEYDSANTQWNVSSVTLNDGDLVLSALEEACYIYNGSSGSIMALSSGHTIVELADDETSGYWMKVNVPECNSRAVFAIDGSNSSANSYDMYLYTLANDYDGALYSAVGSFHNIILRNNKSTDVTFTVVDNSWQDGGNNCDGVISSGLDSNNSFTVKANDFVEISIYICDFTNDGYTGIPVIIVKDGYQSNVTETPI